jgi:hypothetical protein
MGPRTRTGLPARVGRLTEAAVMALPVADSASNASLLQPFRRRRLAMRNPTGLRLLLI